MTERIDESGGAALPVSDVAVSSPKGGGRGVSDKRSFDSKHRPVPCAPNGRSASREEPNGAPIYGALDLGTNNCRLLVARPSRRGFQVIDAFSRIIRLGEGVSQTGRLSDAAIARTLDALKICSDKIQRRNVRRSRLIATEACRIAENGGEFVNRVREETGLTIEVISRETEARLAVAGCASLLDRDCDWALVFDIGGGSTELIWVDLARLGSAKRHSMGDRARIQSAIAAWTSLPVGVVTLAERFGGQSVDRDVFEAMVAAVREKLAPFEAQCKFARPGVLERAHLLGTSGTVTTVAGVHLKLPAYSRAKVDGCWLTGEEAQRVTEHLLGLSYRERSSQPCIGPDRADLVLAGCAILEAILRLWPCKRLRVADRGLREGILTSLISEDQRKKRNGRHG